MVAATMYLDQLHPPAGETLESADLRRVDDVLDDTGDHSGRLARAALVTPSGPTSPRHGAPSSIRTASAAGGTAVTTAARDRAHWRQVAILGQRARMPRMAAGMLAPCGADRVALRGIYDHAAARVGRADRRLGARRAHRRS